MKSLLLIAHGSRRQESNQEIAELCASLKHKTQAQFAETEYAFLELAQPSIEDAVDALVAKGAQQIVVLPYFLSAGRHVHEDIPAIIAEKQKQHGNVELQMAPYLGEASELVDVLIGLSQQSH